MNRFQAKSEVAQRLHNIIQAYHPHQKIPSHDLKTNPKRAITNMKRFLSSTACADLDAFLKVIARIPYLAEGETVPYVDGIVSDDVERWCASRSHHLM